MDERNISSRSFSTQYWWINSPSVALESWERIESLINTAYSYEALMDEIIFIIGPIVSNLCCNYYLTSSRHDHGILLSWRWAPRFSSRNAPQNLLPSLSETESSEHGFVLGITSSTGGLFSLHLYRCLFQFNKFDSRWIFTTTSRSTLHRSGTGDLGCRKWSSGHFQWFYQMALKGCFAFSDQSGLYFDSDSSIFLYSLNGDVGGCPLSLWHWGCTSNRGWV
jgi:hypothetical protein